jgi:hypothetical protein
MLSFPILSISDLQTHAIPTLDNLGNDERPRHRRPRQRMPHQPRPNHGFRLRCLRLLLRCLSIPRVQEPAYNETGSFTPVVMAFAFLLGLQMCNIFLVLIKSGVSTFFVAMAFDPEVLISNFPDLYARLVQVYSHVQQAIHAERRRGEGMCKGNRHCI